MTLQHSIETLSGSMFDFDAPTPETIDVEDIAVALGNTCRFGGHVKRYYSVAEHAVLVYQMVRDGGFPADVCFAALHHDSHEAYLGDVPTPLKRKIKVAAPGVWEAIAGEVDYAIATALGVRLALADHDAVKAADEIALNYEAAVLKPSGGVVDGLTWKTIRPEAVPAGTIKCWSPYTASEWFLVSHDEALAAL